MRRRERRGDRHAARREVGGCERGQLGSQGREKRRVTRKGRRDVVDPVRRARDQAGIVRQRQVRETGKRLTQDKLDDLADADV